MAADLEKLAHYFDAHSEGKLAHDTRVLANRARGAGLKRVPEDGELVDRFQTRLTIDGKVDFDISEKVRLRLFSYPEPYEDSLFLEPKELWRLRNANSNEWQTFLDSQDPDVLRSLPFSIALPGVFPILGDGRLPIYRPQDGSIDRQEYWVVSRFGKQDTAFMYAQDIAPQAPGA